MISKQRIEDLIRDLLEEREFYVVDLEVNPGNNISLELDGFNGVSISDCVDFSRQIEHNLDREEEDFELHVSSAGLDKPFRVRQQYEKNLGKEVAVVTNEGGKVKGTLAELNEDDILITFEVKERVEGKKKKIKVQKEERIKFVDIKETKIIISFK